VVASEPDMRSDRERPAGEVDAIDEARLVGAKSSPCRLPPTGSGPRPRSRCRGSSRTRRPPRAWEAEGRPILLERVGDDVVVESARPGRRGSRRSRRTPRSRRRSRPRHPRRRGRSSSSCSWHEPHGDAERSIVSASATAVSPSRRPTFSRTVGRVDGAGRIRRSGSPAPRCPAPPGCTRCRRRRRRSRSCRRSREERSSSNSVSLPRGK